MMKSFLRQKQRKRHRKPAKKLEQSLTTRLVSEITWPLGVFTMLSTNIYGHSKSWIMIHPRVKRDITHRPRCSLHIWANVYHQMFTILKKNVFCLNCLKPGHHLKQCPLVHRCQGFQRPHHTWSHLDKEANPQRQTNASPSLSQNTPGNVTSRMSQSSDHHPRVLLPTCQVRTIGLDGSTTIARVLLDSASFTFFCNRVSSVTPPLTASISSHANQRHRSHHRTFRFMLSS